MKPEWACATCDYWQPASQARGTCHRRAPIRIDRGNSVEPGWPPTLANDWCADYQPREGEKPL